MAWLSHQDMATERQVKYLRDLARRRGLRVNADMSVDKLAASDQVRAWTSRRRKRRLQQMSGKVHGLHENDNRLNLQQWAKTYGRLEYV
eukprot:5226696-Amphidinium_carterae.1